MPIEFELRNGELAWIKNPITGVISYVVELQSKNFAFTLGGHHRGSGEHVLPRTITPDEIAAAIAACPFCPGNEHQAPPEVMRLGPEQFSRSREPAPPWIVRVFNNLFPRIPIELTGGRNESYVLVEDPRHFIDSPKSPADLLHTGELDEEHFVKLIGCAAEVSRMALRNPSVSSVVIRKNQGRESGASQPHVHQQVIGSPVPLPVLTAEARAQRDHPSLWEELLELVRRLGLVIEERGGVVSYTSPIGTFPRSYEVIVPGYRGLLCDLDPATMAHFAVTLHRLMRVLGPLPLDYEIHQGEGLPLHAHLNGRLFPYANVAGTLNLPSTLLRNTEALRRTLGKLP